MPCVHKIDTLHHVVSPPCLIFHSALLTLRLQRLDDETQDESKPLPSLSWNWRDLEDLSGARATNHSFPCLRCSGRRRKRTEVAKEEGKEREGERERGGEESFWFSSLSLAGSLARSPVASPSFALSLSAFRARDRRDRPRRTALARAPFVPCRLGSQGGHLENGFIRVCIGFRTSLFLYSSLCKFKLQMYTCHSPSA